VSPALLVAATGALAKKAPILTDETAGLLPDVSDVREISVEIACDVIKAAVKEGLNQRDDIPEADDELEDWIQEQMWDPKYRPLRRVDPQDATPHARGETGTGTIARGAQGA
jgi:malate dehydrogenase (oxaloacetate-decarboxylating)